MFPRGVSSEMPRESPTYLCCIKQWGKPISPFSWKAYHVLSGCLQRGRWRWVGLVAGRSHGRGRRGDDEIRGLGCREEEKISSRISLAKKGMGKERGNGDLCSLVSHGTLGGRRIATTKQGLGEEGGEIRQCCQQRRDARSVSIFCPLCLFYRNSLLLPSVWRNPESGGWNRRGSGLPAWAAAGLGRPPPNRSGRKGLADPLHSFRDSPRPSLIFQMVPPSSND